MTNEEILDMAILLVVGRHKEGVRTADIMELFGIKCQGVGYRKIHAKLIELRQQGVLICRTGKPSFRGNPGLTWLPGRLFPAAYKRRSAKRSSNGQRLGGP